MKKDRISIFAVSGSLRSKSTNLSLLRAVAQLAAKNFDFHIYNGLAGLPHFNPEIENNGAPESVKDFRDQLTKADCVLICTPEYAFGMPGVLKNALDWIVSSGELVDKPVATISASPSFLGGDKAHASLLLTLSALGASIVENGTLTVPGINTKLAADGQVTDKETIESLKSILEAIEKTEYTNVADAIL